MTVHFADAYLERLIRQERVFRGDATVTKTAKSLMHERLVQLRLERQAGHEPQPAEQSSTVDH